MILKLLEKILAVWNCFSYVNNKNLCDLSMTPKIMLLAPTDGMCPVLHVPHPTSAGI